MISGEDYLINLGIHIRQMRERNDLSQQNLADMCNFPKSTIARIERAEMNTSIKILVKIANAFEIEPKTLLDFQIK
jgi:transcriptional regulator with XRE-family HTH domain